MKYTIVVSRGEEMLIGRVKEIPAVLTQGADIEEVLNNVSDALGMHLHESEMNFGENAIVSDELNFGEVILTRELEFA
jgi:predicted RNase H-like HicB family nuclease